MIDVVLPLMCNARTGSNNNMHNHTEVVFDAVLRSCVKRIAAPQPALPRASLVLSLLPAAAVWTDDAAPRSVVVPETVHVAAIAQQFAL